jgi:hypothetical protein
MISVIASYLGTFVLGSAIGLTVKNAVDIAVIKVEMKVLKNGEIQSNES